MTVYLRRLRTVNKISFMQERIAHLYLMMGDADISHRIDRSIVQHEWTALHGREVSQFPFWRYEKSRDHCVSAIGEQPGPSSCSQDIDVIKFYEPYRDRFAKVRWDLLPIVCCVPVHLDNTLRKLKQLENQEIEILL